MSKILFIPYAPQLGTFYGLIDIAHFFKKLGHSVYFAGDGKFIEIAEKEGFPCNRLPEIPFSIYRKKVDRGTLGIHDYQSAKHFVEEEVKLYKLLKPRLVITQGRVTVPLSTKILNIPSISITVPVLTEHYDYPKKIPESLSFSFLSNIPIINNVINNNMGNYFRFMAKQWIKPLNKVAKDYGIEPYNNLYDLYKGSFLTLIPEQESIFPLNESYKKDNLKYCGPLLHYKNYPLPTWYKKARKHPGKCIYLSMGSSSLELYPLVLKKMIEVFGNNNRYKVISNTTYTIDQESASIDLPNNFFITNIAPADKMLALADVTICHGGKGTIYDSIIGNVPIIGIPQQAEQEMNLLRLKELGIGDIILAKRFKKMSNLNFKESIDAVLNSREMLLNIKEHSKTILLNMNKLEETVNLIHYGLLELHA